MRKGSFLLGVVSIAIISCGGSSSKKEGETTTTTEKKETVTMAINETEWEMKDLSTISPMVPVSVKVPKDAKLEKNGNGGVDIRVNDYYVLQVSAPLAAASVKEVKDLNVLLTVGNTNSYMNGKTITDEPNGFIYSIQMKDEVNGTKYEPEAHFYYYLLGDGVIYSISDARPIDNFFAPGSNYSEATAKQIYDIVKGSAKIN